MHPRPRRSSDPRRFHCRHWRDPVSAACPDRVPAPAPVPGRAPAQAPEPYPGMPPIPDRANVYSETGADHLSAAVADALARVYVPHVTSSDVYVIDPATMKVIN